MALVIPPGFGQAAFVFSSSAGTGPFVTTLGVDLSGAGGDFVTAANDLMLRYGTALGAQTSNALTLERVTLAIGNDGPGGSVDSDASPIAMTNGSAPGPMAMAVIARKVTNQFGRYGRGRMFLPGVNQEGGVDPDGSLSTTYRGAIETALNAFYVSLTANAGIDYPPVLLHSEGPYGAPTPITGFVVGDLVGWIRGRIR